MKITRTWLPSGGTHPFEKLRRSPVVRHIWRVLRDVDIRKPLVSEFVVGEYLQATIETYPLDEAISKGVLRGHDVSLPDSILSEADRIVRVDPRLPYARKRFTIFHDYTHLILPWHQGNDFGSLEKDFLSNRYIQLEREADMGACELAMPIHWFVGDIVKWKEVSWQAISCLANDD